MIKATALLVAGCLFFAGCGVDILPPDMERDLGQANQQINNFRIANSRLPTRDEFHSWAKTNKSSHIVEYELDEIHGTNNYFLYIWLGEKMAKYSSERKAMVSSR